MIGIQTIASYIPSFKESNYERKEIFNITDDFIEKKIGVKSKARKTNDEETSDMCCRAFDALTNKIDISRDEIDCLVVCTQNPDGCGLPHTSAIVHGKIGGHEHMSAFDISLGCSGYVYSLSIIISFMNANNMKKGLLFTADPYSKIIDPNDKNTSLLFGDAATVTYLSDRPTFTMGKTLFGTKGKDSDSLKCVDNRLNMNGRGIFNFSISTVPNQIKELFKSINFELEDIDLYIFHQGSKYIINVLTNRLGLNPKKVPVNISNIGNTVSSSIPLILEEHLMKSQINNILISGFGVGLSWASSILSRVDT